MNKITVDAVIVVEGKSDVQFLESFIEADFITTNGSEVSRETIECIKSLSKIKKIIVLTDPDTPGKRIRDILDEHIEGLYHAFVDKKKCIRKNKVGVAESSSEHIIETLKHLCGKKEQRQSDLKMSDLQNLGLTGSNHASKLREKVMKELHIGFGNAKTLLKRLQIMNIDKNNLKEIVKRVSE